jgi:hypothetical protein
MHGITITGLRTVLEMDRQTRHFGTSPLKCWLQASFQMEIRDCKGYPDVGAAVVLYRRSMLRTFAYRWRIPCLKPKKVLDCFLVLNHWLN